MVGTVNRMATKKKPSDTHHKPRRLVGLPERICAILERMGKERETSLTEMAKHGLIEFLKSQGEWPPPQK